MKYNNKIFNASQGAYDFTKQTSKMIQALRLKVLVALFMLIGVIGISQTINIPTGSFIINMGITPQTIGNGLKPYGLIYDLIANEKVSVIWSINPNKNKDQDDFVHNGVHYRGGTFIISANQRTTAVNNKITLWQGRGVVGASTVDTQTVPVFKTLQTVPRWTLDQDNGDIAATYFVNAGIPASAHGGTSSSGWKKPSALNCCDDIYVMPHADPVWSTHNRLLSWNLDCKGSIWAACHAVSALENMVNPANRSQQTNFLTVKNSAFTGAGGNYANNNSLILWSYPHLQGTKAYDYRLPADPVAQFMQKIDKATINGSEQIYIPRQGNVADPRTFSNMAISRWNPGAKVIAYDKSHPEVTNPNLTDFRNVAAVLVYGRGFDDPNRGYVMYEAGHNHNDTEFAKEQDRVAAQRAFLNFSFLSSSEKAPIIDLASLPNIVTSGSNNVFNIAVQGGTAPITVSWSSTCGGSFLPNNSTSLSTTYTAPLVNVPTACNIRVTVTDLCGRQSNLTIPITINPCVLTVTPTVTNVACNGGTTGSISMAIMGSAGPYTWNWSRVSPAGIGNGTGTLISGLSAGSYNVTVTAPVGCQATFTQLITQPNLLTVVPTVTNYLCFGQTGSIVLTPNGGTPAYTYNWADIVGTNDPKDRSGLTAGSYNVTVTDSRGCTTSTMATITGPSSGVSIATTAKTNVSCNGGTNGTINITASGGTPGYTYAWSDGPTLEDRTGLAAGTYTVTVTDANGCTATRSETITQPPALVISLTKMNPTCPPGANPPFNSNGSIDLTVSGGTPLYMYNWTTMGGSGLINGNQDQTNLTAGTYNVTVTDANGCTAMTSVVLTNTNTVPPTPMGINNN
jgi:SprB repeat